MDQQELFHEDFDDALRHAVKALGGFHAVGAALWPAKTLQRQYDDCRDCLDSKRNLKFSTGEIVSIMRMARLEGIHCAMHQLADATGYARPDIAPRKTRYQSLAEQFERQATKLKNLADEMAAAEQAETNVHPIGGK